MATIPVPLDPRSALSASTNGAQHVVTDGTNFPVAGLAFDAATEESVFWSFRALRYGSGNLTLDGEWYANTASSGDVIFGVQIAAITPNTDTQDVETKAFATAQTVTDTHLGTTGKRLHTFAITISNLDSLTANDAVCLKFYRKAADAGDTMAGDAIVTMCTLSYSDT